MTPLKQNALDRIKLYVKEIGRIETAVMDCLDDLSHTSEDAEIGSGSETERRKDAFRRLRKASDALSIASMTASDAVEILQGENQVKNEINERS